MPVTHYDARFDFTRFNPVRMREFCRVYVGVPDPYNLSERLVRADQVFYDLLDATNEDIMWQYYTGWCRAVCARERRRYGPPRGYDGWEGFVAAQWSPDAEAIWRGVHREALHREARILRRALREDREAALGYLLGVGIIQNYYP
jgi:hypothetical protein